MFLRFHLQARIRTLGGRIAVTILSLRFFIFQYGIVYKLNVKGDSTSLTVYGLSWVVLAVLIVLFKVFTFSQKLSANFRLLLRVIQGVSFLLALAGLAAAFKFTDLSIADVFASILAFIYPLAGEFFLLEILDGKDSLVQVHSFHCPSIPRWDGDAHIHTHCTILLVPICIDIPNAAHVQPGFRPRVGDLSRPCWKQPQYRNIVTEFLRSLYASVQVA
ncbi:hypothetical protein DVH24_038101 [Malus domestica]|uniref:Uncharacterized protein n=1 Tax=Malus domestica TaxID=3750 RepID=A0A498K964_MALDO|nr:hypothetical protein DVH24_038101 [Malus domestica]